MGSSPESIARIIEKIMNTPSPRLRYSAGDLVEKMAVPLKSFTVRDVRKILMKQYGLTDVKPKN